MDRHTNKSIIDRMERVYKEILGAELCNWSCLMNDFYKKVIIACHGMMIQAMTGGHLPKNGEIVEFEMER